MKPYRKNRSLAYYRHHRKRAIARKKRILISYYEGYTKNLGRLSKGKIHCSCMMCTEKTRYLGYSKSDQIKIMKCDYQIGEYRKCE